MRRAATLLALALAGLVPARARAGDDPALARVVRHRIEARLEPSTHRIVARDVLDLEGNGRTLRFALPSDFRVSSVRLEGGADLPQERTYLSGWDFGPGRWSSRVLGYLVDLPAGAKAVEIRYDGPTPDGTLRSAAEVLTSAPDLPLEMERWIAEDGVYLGARSGWFPACAPAGTKRFDVTTYVPSPFLVVTQGGVPERSDVSFPKGWASDTEVAPPSAPAAADAGTTYHRSAVRAVMPTEGCALSAGPYRVQSREIEGIAVSTYFLEDDAADAGLWLDAAEGVLGRYERTLGSYPHPKFDLVENPFPQRDGSPSFVLLGIAQVRTVSQAAKTTGEGIPPRTFEHAYVRGWFGNGLFATPIGGRWCDALETYLSRTLAPEHASAEAGVEHRRALLERGAMGVPLDERDEVRRDQESLVFHMLRRRIGDEAFFARVKRLSTDRVGTAVSWNDWLTLLEGQWIRPWIEREGGPAVRLASTSCWPARRADATAEPDPSRWVVRAEAVIEARPGEGPWPPFDLDVDVDGKKVGTLRMEGASGTWRGVVEKEPRTLELDARYDVLRRIADGDLPACLNRTLAAPGAQVSFPAGVAPFEALALALSKEKGLAIVEPDPERRREAPLVALEVARDGMKRWPPDVRPGRIEIAGKVFEGEEYSLLFSFLRDGVPNTRFVAMSPETASRARTLLAYGWDEYVVWKAGEREPVARGFFERTPRGTKRAVAVGDEVAAGIDATVVRLASDACEGRRPGTLGHDLAAGTIATELSHAGFEGIEGLGTSGIHEFGLGVADLLSSRDLVLTTEAGTETIPDAFWPIFASPERAKGTPIPYAEGAGAVPAPGRVPDASPEGLARFWEQVESGTAPALLIAPSKATREALAPLLDAPNARTAETEAFDAAAGTEGKSRFQTPIGQRVGRRRAQAMPGATPLRVPVLVLSDAAIARLERAPTVTAIDFEVRFGPERATWAAGKGGKTVVLGRIPAHLPKEGTPVVVLSAHYDGPGKQGDALHRGADDASGVACVLAAARALAKDFEGPEAKTGLVICLFDGEAQGLLGSRALVPLLARRFHVIANVDVGAVGRVRDDTVLVRGAASDPALAAQVTAALASAGLSTGSGPDAVAFAGDLEPGPFPAAGIPAIAFRASDEGARETPADVADKIDPVGVARLSAALTALVRALSR